MNLILYYVYNVVWYVLSLIVSGAVFQTFLLEYGISEEAVAAYCSVMQVVQSVSMLVTAKWMDRQKNVLRATAYTMLPGLLMLVLLLFMCFWKNIEIDLVTYLVFGIGFVLNVFMALGITLAYKVPYHIMDMEQYAVVISVSGAFLNLANILCTTAISISQRWFSYFDVMMVLLLIGVLLIPVGMWSLFKMKDNGYVKNVETQTKKKKGNIFKYQPFRKLFPADILRGLCGGVFGLLVSVGYHQGVLDVKSASLLATISFVMAFLQCLTYPLLSKKMGERRMIRYFSIGTLILLPLMLVGKNTYLYLSLYAALAYVINMINNAVPVAITKIVDYEIMGEYSSWRLLLNAAGNAIGGFLCIPLIKMYGGIVALGIFGACQLASGIIYSRYMRKYVKADGK